MSAPVLRRLLGEQPRSPAGPDEITRERARFLSLRGRLLALVVLVLLPWFGLVLYTGAEQRQIAVAHAQDNALRLVHLVASSQAAQIEAAEELLTAFARLPQLRTNDAPACNAFLAEMLAAYPLYLNFGVIEPNGNLFCSALPFQPPVTSADRPYFQEVMKTRRFTIGDYQIGRVTGRASFLYVYPIVGAAGNVDAVVFAAKSLAGLTLALGDVELPAGAVLIVTDRLGVILARVPDDGSWIGQTLPEKRVVEDLFSRPSGVFEAEDAKGVRRLWAHAALTPDGKLQATIGTPTDVALADVRRVLIGNLAGLGLVTVLALAAAWFGGKFFILDQVDALVDATTRLAAGDLGARTRLVGGRSELNLLARRFNDMGATLQQRDLELRAAEEREQKVQIELAVTRAHMNIARQIQDSFLPRGPLMLNGVQFTGRCIPAAVVGGDYFGYFPRGRNAVDSFIGDVSGHGIGAALLMAEARSVFMGERLVERSAATILSHLNDLLYDDLDRVEFFMTAFCATYDAEVRELSYANAGHPPPLLLSANGTQCTPLDADGLPLGFKRGVRFTEARVKLQAGDTVLFYTDGVTETQNAAGDLFGSGRLCEVLATCRHEPPETLIDSILATLRGFAGAEQPTDDVALVVMKLTA